MNMCFIVTIPNPLKILCVVLNWSKWNAKAIRFFQIYHTHSKLATTNACGSHRPRQIERILFYCYIPNLLIVMIFLWFSHKIKTSDRKKKNKHETSKQKTVCVCVAVNWTQTICELVYGDKSWFLRHIDS